MTGAPAEEMPKPAQQGAMMMEQSLGGPYRMATGITGVGMIGYTKGVALDPNSAN
jgi:hypothetical protein